MRESTLDSPAQGTYSKNMSHLMPGFENQWGLHLGELKSWVKLRLYLLKGSHTNLPASSPRTVAIA